MNPNISAPAGKKPEANSTGSFCRRDTQSPVETVTTAHQPTNDSASSHPEGHGGLRTNRPVGEIRRQRGIRRRTVLADVSPTDLVAIVDSREQNPLDLQPLRQTTGTLVTGDYSLRGLESVIAIERKSLADMLGCVGQERDRFHREVLRLLAYPVRALVIESTWPQIERGQWRSKIRAPAALGSVLNWIAMGLPVIMAGDHPRAGRYVSRILFIAARRRWREARALVALG
jgi:DNA excision repair protein ERCC-4